MADKNTVPLIFSKLIAIMNDIDYVGKKGQNTSQGYGFRKADDVNNHLHPLFAKHGVVVTPEILDERTEERVSKSGSATIYRVLKVKHTYTAAEDASSTSATTMGEGMDTGDKASNKAMTASRKYADCQVLCIPTDDPKDPENDSHDLNPNGATSNTSTGSTATKKDYSMVKNSTNQNSGDYVITYKSVFNGKKLKEIGVKKLQDHVDWIKSLESPGFKLIECLNEAEKYLGSLNFKDQLASNLVDSNDDELFNGGDVPF